MVFPSKRSSKQILLIKKNELICQFLNGTRLQQSQPNRFSKRIITEYQIQSFVVIPAGSFGTGNSERLEGIVNDSSIPNNN